ncbi:MAG: MFS transporter [Planctomycetia bacterium]|nr:MFS transporter [Planctomycetia bacterium]
MNKLLDVEQPTRVRYWVLGWLCTLSMITYIDRVCIMQVQDDMKRDLGLTTDQFSYAFSAFALAYAAFEVPTGWLGDRIGPRKVLTRIMLCWLGFTALTGAVWNWTSLIVVRFLFGAGEAGAYPNIARASKNWFSYRQRGLAQGLIWTFGRWGGAMAPVLIGLLALPWGWRGAFVLLGLIGLVWVIFFRLRFRDTPQEHDAVNDTERALIAGPAPASAPAPLSWRSVLTSPTLWCLSFMYFCSNSGWSFFITWVALYVKRDLGMSGIAGDLASGAPLFLGGIGCLLGGPLTDRAVRVLGPRWGRTLQGFIAYFLGATLFLAGGLITDSLPVLAFWSICFASFFKDFAMAASWSTTLDIGHRYSGTVAGLMNTVGNLGTVVTPPIVAQIVKRLGEDNKFGISLYYYAAMFIIASLTWLFINPRRVIVYAPADRERLEAEGVLS